ncbi:MAG: hypothetical protein RIC55_15495 [Pirellulaceae bacterium]
MPTHTANWEDEENNRLIELSVEYRLADDRIEIENVTPTSILFIDAASLQPRRRLGVHTDKGREMLRRQHAQRIGHGLLREQIESSLLANAR